MKKHSCPGSKYANRTGKCKSKYSGFRVLKGSGRKVYPKSKELSCKSLKALIKDEAMATKEYRDYGLKSLSRDEHRHHEYLMKLYKMKCKR